MTDTAWVALSLVDRVGGKTLRALLQHFSDPRAVLAADVEALRRVRGVGPQIAHNIRAVDLARIEAVIPGWQAAGVALLTWRDAAYPPPLYALDDAPPTLFVHGHWEPLSDKTVAIVGTREPSPAAEQVAKELSMELAERGYTIVSGLAVGIDAAAHHGALAVAGHTLAVLGSGVLNVYPPQHQDLAEAIQLRGALLSEVQPFAETNASALVARNRIITGLSQQVIVVETATDGGAMHAARFAGLQRRRLYTLDLPASGNRALLANGATGIRLDLRDLPF